MREKYGGLLDLPRPVSKKHPPMSMAERAAQFAPFAALTGLGAALGETARLTEERIELDESEKERLDWRLRQLREQIPRRPEVTFTCFVPDGRKAGGAYERITGRVKKLEEPEGRICLEGGRVLPIEDILALEGDFFREEI